MKSALYLLVIMFILASCTPSPEKIGQAVEGTLSAISTATPYPTYTQESTFTPQATFSPLPTYTIPPTQTPQIIIVTETGTQAPLYTPTITETPTDTETPLPTADKLKFDMVPGIYLVGVDISPGVWRSDGDGDGCYWERADKTGEIINNFFGMAGGTIYIAPSDFQVQLDEKCGNWHFLQDP